MDPKRVGVARRGRSGGRGHNTAQVIVQDLQAAGLTRLEVFSRLTEMGYQASRRAQLMKLYVQDAVTHSGVAHARSCAATSAAPTTSPSSSHTSASISVSSVSESHSGETSAQAEEAVDSDINSFADDPIVTPPVHIAIASAGHAGAAMVPRRLNRKTTDVRQVFGYPLVVYCPGQPVCKYSLESPGTASAIRLDQYRCHWCDAKQLAVRCRNAQARIEIASELAVFWDYQMELFNEAKERVPMAHRREVCVLAWKAPAAFISNASIEKLISKPDAAERAMKALRKLSPAIQSLVQEMLTDEQNEQLTQLAVGGESVLRAEQAVRKYGSKYVSSMALEVIQRYDVVGLLEALYFTGRPERFKDFAVTVLHQSMPFESYEGIQAFVTKLPDFEDWVEDYTTTSSLQPEAKRRRSTPQRVRPSRRCQNADCCWSSTGGPMRADESELCIFCDVDLMEERLAKPRSRGIFVKSMKAMPEEWMRELVLESFVPEPWRQHLRAALETSGCEGREGRECNFGMKGAKASPKDSTRCMICDEGTYTLHLTDKKKRCKLLARLRSFTAEIQKDALDLMPHQDLRAGIEALLQRSRWCVGTAGEECFCALRQRPGKAQTKGAKATCFFCSPEDLQNAEETTEGRQAIESKLRCMSLASRTKIVHERLQLHNKRYFEHLLEGEATRRHNSGCEKIRLPQQDDFTSEDVQSLHAQARALWQPILDRRRVVSDMTDPDIEEGYRQAKLADRSKSLGMMNQPPPPRAARGEDVSNELPLPVATESRLAVQLELWAKFNSWQVCKDCGTFQPRDLTPESMEYILSPECLPTVCRVCKSKQQAQVPSAEAVPEALQQLDPWVQATLSPLELDFGPEIRSKDAFGRPNGYRQHAAILRFSWQAESVEARIQQLPSNELRTIAENAYMYLMHTTGPGREQTAYGEFVQEHLQFLRRKPHATDNERKRWLRFIEREGVECAAWPTLFWCRGLCLTWVREQFVTRTAVRDRTTVEHLMHPEILPEQEEHGFFGSTKRSYMALVMSPMLDYAESYELLHFAFDLNLWSAIGSKRNLQVGVPLRLMMKGHTFSPLYWQDLHRTLIDLVRQRGFPPIFLTQSPLEWSTPSHVAIDDAMHKNKLARMRMPVLECLHQAHLLTQTSKHALSGANKKKERAATGYAHQIFDPRIEDGDMQEFSDFVRLEFQDGSKKEATQDYHGSGRPHSHSVHFADNVQAMKLERSLCASTDGLSSNLQGYLLADTDRSGKSKLPINEGCSYWDKETDKLVLHHTPDDASRGIGPIVKDLMAANKCHNYAVVKTGEENYSSYVSKYVPKMSDAMQEELLNDDADANTVAASVLARYKPYEPEMVMQLFGAWFRQWHISTESGGRRAFQPPVPDQGDVPAEIRLYEKCTWRSETLSLLDYLRKSNNDGNIAGWLQTAHHLRGQGQSLEEFVASYKMKGEKVVAIDYLSWLNDRRYGQWLVMNVPFRNLQDLVPAEVTALVPKAHKYLAMCVKSEDPVAARVFGQRDVNTAWLENEMKIEAHGRAFRDTVLHYITTSVGLIYKYLDGRLSVADLPPQQQQGIPAHRRIRLPIQRKYVDLIANGSKTIEGRVNKGVASGVAPGDILQLGSLECLVAEVHTCNNFSDMLDQFGVDSCMPNVGCKADALHVYHGLYPNAQADAAFFKVKAFELAEVPEDLQLRQIEREEDMTWHPRQQRFLTLATQQIDNVLALQNANSEEEQDSARDICVDKNKKMLVVEGPPGTGKTTVAYHLIEMTLKKPGGKAIACAYTGALASRMRQKLGTRPNLHIDTCHAGMGFGEDFSSVAYALAPYALAFIDEFSQLNDEHFTHLGRLRSAIDYANCMVLSGDRRQMAGLGEARPWHSHLWRKATFSTELVELWRCKDPVFKKELGCLRTAMPLETSARGVSVVSIMRHRRAWRGHFPTASDIDRILRTHPHTTLLAVTRKGAYLLNELALEVKFPGAVPLIILLCDVESFPDNYESGKRINNLPQPMPVFIGMLVQLTRNVNKDIDYVNGMIAEVTDYDEHSRGLEVLTVTGHRFCVFLWTDKDLDCAVYYPVKPGYAGTVLKYQGSELPHVTLWLDSDKSPGAAYTGMSRVAYGKDLLIGGNLNRLHFSPAK